MKEIKGNNIYKGLKIKAFGNNLYVGANVFVENYQEIPQFVNK